MKRIHAKLNGIVQVDVLYAQCVKTEMIAYMLECGYRLQTGSCVPCVTAYRLQYRQVRRYRLQTGRLCPLCHCLQASVQAG